MAKKKPAKKQHGALWKLSQPKAFTPFVAPSNPPPSAYDPALDSQVRATERGLSDLSQDTERQGSRALADLQLGQSALATKRTDEAQDFGARMGDLKLQYDRLGQAQVQQARAAGTARGGALLQASRKRGENQAHDQQPIETAHQRFQRDADTQAAAMSLDYSRGVEDRSTGLARAGRELGFFKTDVGAQKWYQARNSGVDLPAAPDNERSKYGVTFRVGGLGKPVGQRQYTLPTGETFNRKQWVGYLGKRKKSGAAPMLYG